MSSTITLKKSIDITSRYIYNAPLFYVNSGELAYSIGDSVRQFILGPPFAWRWNRAFTTPLTLTPGKSDYKIYIPDFGWLEKASFFEPATPPSPQLSHELTVNNCLSLETVLGLPTQISVIADDNNGNITFRLMPSPDVAYQLHIIYQKSAPSFTSTDDTWSPIPDYLNYLYLAGIRALAYEYKGDERFAYSHQEYLKSVVAANDGLSEEQKNIFLGPRIIYQKELQGSVQSGQIARAGRAGL